MKFKGKRNMATKSHWYYFTNSIDSSQKQVISFSALSLNFYNQTTSSKHSPPTHFAYSPKWFWLSFPFSTDHLKSTFKLKIDGLTLTLARAHGLFATKYYSNFIVTTIIKFFTLQWLRIDNSKQKLVINTDHKEKASDAFI